MEGEEEEEEAPGSFSVSSFCPALTPGDEGAPFCQPPAHPLPLPLCFSSKPFSKD